MYSDSIGFTGWLRSPLNGIGQGGFLIPVCLSPSEDRARMSQLENGGRKINGEIKGKGKEKKKILGDANGLEVDSLLLYFHNNNHSSRQF